MARTKKMRVFITICIAMFFLSITAFLHNLVLLQQEDDDLGLQLNPLETEENITTLPLTLKILTPEEEYIDERHGFHPSWHPIKISERFPNVTERLKIYMGNWYLPPCNWQSYLGTESIDERLSYRYDHSANSKFPTVFLTRSIENADQDINQTVIATKDPAYDKVFVLWQNHVWDSNGRDTCPARMRGSHYCSDIIQLVKLAMHLKKKSGHDLSQIPPILAMLGDLSISPHNLPLFQKARQSTTRNDLKYIASEGTGRNCMKGSDNGSAESGRKNLIVQSNRRRTSNSGIIWPLNYKRHFESGQFDQVRMHDIPWKKEKDQAIWRGAVTGWRREIPKELGHTFTTMWCENLPRCHLVNKYQKSSLLDVGFYNIGGFKEVYNMPEDFFKPQVSRIQHFSYKAIIMMEGNDVATGLKWALYSRSVVLMPIPRRTSYAMEEWLEPWTHYVPINIHKDNLGENENGGNTTEVVSDVEEKMQWVLDNDQEARKIAERATLFIHDFLFDEHSSEENQRIKEEILERYFEFFVPQ